MSDNLENHNLFFKKSNNNFLIYKLKIPSLIIY